MAECPYCGRVCAEKPPALEVDGFALFWDAERKIFRLGLGGSTNERFLLVKIPVWLMIGLVNLGASYLNNLAHSYERIDMTEAWNDLCIMPERIQEVGMQNITPSIMDGELPGIQAEMERLLVSVPDDEIDESEMEGTLG